MEGSLYWGNVRVSWETGQDSLTLLHYMNCNAFHNNKQLNPIVENAVPEKVEVTVHHDIQNIGINANILVGCRTLPN